MTNPSMPNIPGMEAVADTLEFVKNLWGNMGIPGMGGAGTPGAMPGMNIPGMVMPTLSVEEINKKIADLKAVEAWLNLNLGMLRGTIQALEVQSATISTLQTMGQTFAASMSAGLKEGSEARPSGGNGSGSGASAAGGNGHAAGESTGAGEASPGAQPDAAMFTAPLVNAAAWWNALQEQFANAVTSAMTDSAKAMSAASPEQEKSDTKPKRAASGAAGSSRRKNGKSSGET